ncbi:HAD-IIIC family phosphatase [Paenibacillus sp. GCM10012306]|uniref:HAD-IIIC family phosphatase n=1 Tax=Paenibacillus sp. GCM10012306 TaxID=3317342 RepID=UPI003618F15B
MTKKTLKLVVWDLDDTLWDGIISQDTNVTLNKQIPEIIRTLDSRGILQSVSSKNDYEPAMEMLKHFGLAEYFIYPQINWEPKHANIKYIIEQINIGEDTVAFIDDQEFERGEVKHYLPQVTCIAASEISGLLDRKDLNPQFITADSSLRRQMYQNDIVRKQAESEFQGDSTEFLKTLQMAVTISEAQESDLQRAEELTVRTHQLNSTGYTYSHEELKALLNDDSYKVLVVDLNDVYGGYGTIGLALLQCDEEKWIIKLLITSCRVISRGIGTMLLGYIINLALALDKTVYAEFIKTNRNRIMEITYSIMQFNLVKELESKQLLKYEGTGKVQLPEYIRINEQEIIEAK